jgi:hypothetical protein
MNRSYPEGKRLLLCISTVRVTLAFPLPRNPPNERRRKPGQSEHARREGHAAQARPVKQTAKRDLEMIPGNRGMVGTGWLARPPQDAVNSVSRGHNSPVPLVAFARRQSREKEQGGQER